MDAIIGGLSDIDKDQPADFSHGLEHVWSHVFPALNALNGSNVIVVWTCNQWQIATMNVRSNGFFLAKDDNREIQNRFGQQHDSSYSEPRKVLT